MEPLTLLATGVTIILTGALTRVGELSLDGAIAQLKNSIVVKSPEIWKQLEATAKNPAALPKTIEVMATLLEDQELREVAEQVTKENESNPYVTKMMAQIKQVGLEKIEAAELDAELEQVSTSKPTTIIEQTGVTGLKVEGKAMIKIKQTIN
jgi:exopolysaccharide biosynthesis predicted pyruvyltransferase EpsI